MGWWEAVAAWWDRLLVGLGLRRPRLAADARLDLATARAGVAHVEAVAAVRANQPPLIRAPMRALVQELGERAVRLGELAGEPSEGLRADGLELAELATRAPAHARA